MEWTLKITGALLILLASIHIGFPKYFKWKEELASLSLMNRQMMTTHAFFIAFFVGGIGLINILQTEALIHTEFGKFISAAFAIFWGTRLFFQWFIYSPKLWKGKKFETAMHILFSLFWIFLTSIYSWIAWS